MSMPATDPDFERDYDREMFRSAIFSALWALVTAKKRGGVTLSDIAAKIGKDKGYVSRLFSRKENCKLNAVADLAHAMDAEVRIEIVDRVTGVRYGPTGPVKPSKVHAPHVVTNVYPMGPAVVRPMRTSVRTS